MKHTPILFSLALLGSLSLSPLASAAETPSAQQVCAALTKSAKKAGKKADAKAKARLALAASIKRLEKEPENVNVGSKGKGITPIMIAAALGEKDAIRWLISIGADPAIKDAAGKDALSRTTDAEVTALLKTGALFTWSEAIAFIENATDEGTASHREQLLKESRKCSTLPPNVAQEPIRSFAALSCGYAVDVKIVSFALRQLELRSIENKPFFVYPIPAGKRLPILNLLEAYGFKYRINFHAWPQNEQLGKSEVDWFIRHLDAASLIAAGNQTGITEMIEAGNQKNKE